MSTIARPCQTCGAQPGEPCHTPSGFRVAPHAARKGPRQSFRSRPSVGNLEHQDRMRELRPIALRRDGCCVRCGSRRGVEVHHRKPTGRNGPDTLENLVTLCGPAPAGCHGWVHDHDAEAHALGLLLHSWDPDPIEAWTA